MTTGRPHALAVALLSVALLCACSSGTPAHVTTVTVAAAPTPTPTATTASAKAAPVAMTKLPGTCRTLLSAAVVNDAVDTSLAGGTNFVVGTADKTIGRVGYLNCRYGVSGSASPAVEIGVSLYRSAAKAAQRVRATAADYDGHGASSSGVRVGAMAAQLLTGGTGPGYDAPTIVLSTGQRTIAISLGDAIPAARQRADLTTLAELALRRTAR